MGTRLELQSFLEGLHPSIKKVYNSPPENFKMEYPCIVYKKTRMKDDLAGNIKYRTLVGYTVMSIDNSPDSAISASIAELPNSRFATSYTKNNLIHDVYNIYF